LIGEGGVVYAGEAYSSSGEGEQLARASATSSWANALGPPKAERWLSIEESSLRTSEISLITEKASVGEYGALWLRCGKGEDCDAASASVCSEENKIGEATGVTGNNVEENEAGR
jgi:hypothetical protein